MEGPGDVAEIELRLDLSACAKKERIPKENKGFQMSVGWVDQGMSQKLSLD